MSFPLHVSTLTSFVARGLSIPRREMQPIITLAGESEDSPILNCQAATSIEEFEAREWNSLVPSDEPQLRWDFLRATEKSGLAQDASYLAVRGPQSQRSTPHSTHDALLGVAVVYRKDIDLLTLASPKLTRFATRIRKGPLKRLLIVRALSCGPVINNCRANFWVSPAIETSLSSRVAELLLSRVTALRGGALQVLFEFRDESVARYGVALQSAGFIRGASLPGTRLDVQWKNFDGYLASMRKFYRRAVNADLKACEGLEVNIESDFSHLADEACALYQNTLERATVVMERLTPAFFAELSGLEQARLVTIREKASGQLLGIEVLMVSEDGVQDLYTGVNYAFNERHNLYFNLVYPGIRLACEQGLSSVSMGQTSYAFKSRLGVESYPLHIFLRHRNPVIQAILKLCRKLIFPIIEVPTHRVFHETAPVTAHSVVVTPVAI